MASRVHITGEEARERLSRSRNRFPSRPGGSNARLLTSVIPETPIDPPIVVPPPDVGGSGVLASINVLEPLSPIRAGEVQEICFSYVCGNPLAVAFGIVWYATEFGALNFFEDDELTDPAFLPVVEFVPETPVFHIPDGESVDDPVGMTEADIERYASRAQIGVIRITGQSDSKFWFNGEPQQDAYPVVTIYQPGVNIDVK